jgi:type I restriction enzyme R subunit
MPTTTPSTSEGCGTAWRFPLDAAIIGEAAQKAFIKLFGSILRLKNILTAFDDFAGNEILSERDFQDYQSLYLNLYAEFPRVGDAEKEAINDDVVFEIELIKQVEINVDYILMLVERYIQARGSGEDKEIRATIERAVNSSPSLRNKKDLIEQFVDSVSTKPRWMRSGRPSSPRRRPRNSSGSSPTKT